MNIQLRTPFGQTLRGNSVTADRWIEIFEALGHRMVDDDADVLVALHAGHSHQAIVDFRARYPGRPVVLALTGTDIYRDVRQEGPARQSLELADRFVVLQPHAVGELPPRHRARARVIFQSALPPADPPPRPTDRFQACVVGHLRDVKDPFRTVEALKLLPVDTAVHVLHVGEALEPGMRERAERQTASCARYRWVGPLSRARTLDEIAGSNLLVLTSVLEGGANVLTEAIACGTPALVSRMGAAEGVLGADYPGLFDVGDTSGLAALLHRASTDSAFYDDLAACCATRRPLTDPALEQESWATLLAELIPDSPQSSSSRPSGRPG